MNAKISQINTKLLAYNLSMQNDDFHIFSLALSGQFHLEFTQSILGKKKFKFVQIKINIYFQEEIIKGKQQK